MQTQFERAELIQQHCETAWKTKASQLTFHRGPVDQLPEDFCVLEFPPNGSRTHWLYATCGMSLPEDAEPVEFFMLSPHQADNDMPELFYAIAHYHITGAPLGLWHTVNFGRPWLPGSKCEFGYFMDAGGSDAEWVKVGFQKVRFLWLIPITAAEREYKVKNGPEALEELLYENDVDFTDPSRPSAI